MNFYSVIRDVADYQNFVPYMTKSIILEQKENKFDAETTIGFSSVNFSYISKVSFREPSYVLSVSGQQAPGSVSSKIFSELYSLWEIEAFSEHQCRVKYKCQMTFANPLYAGVTRQFFDFLAKNAQQSFIDRC